MIVLPWPPSINHYYGRRGNHVYLKKEGKLFRKTVAQIAPALRLKGDLAVRINLHPPDFRRRDDDNVVKAVFDALQHAGVFVDDHQIRLHIVERCGVRRPGAVLVHLADYSPSDMLFTILFPRRRS